MLDAGHRWSRRDFVKLLSCAGIAGAVPTLAHAAGLSPDVITISILHTTDLHGHILPTVDYAGSPDVGGFARCVTQIRRWRRHNPNTILIDVGDIYQGTDVGLRTGGSVMIDLLNHLKFDAWVVGNHEFDWGIDPFINAVQKSAMPVLAANMSLEGRTAGELTDRNHPFSKIRPYLLKEVAGIRIAIIGITTPGMQFWFRPEFIRDLNFLYPIEPVRRAMVQARQEGAQAIVLAGHMGLKTRGGGDDFANNLVGLTNEFPDIAICIAGHTHQLIPRRILNDVLITQADHFGIHVGRVDLHFDRRSKRLIGRDAVCERMDGRYRLNHTVLSRAKPHLEMSAAALAEPVGELGEVFRVRGLADRPSDVEMLIGNAIVESLRERGTAVDGVFHGVFDDTDDLAAGPKTVADIWNVLPFENYIVTAELTADQLCTVMEEVYAVHDSRGLIGFDVQTSGPGRSRQVVSLTRADGAALPRHQKYVIAFNTFDSRSAGHKFMKLRAMLEAPESCCVFHHVQTRDALIDYFRRHQVVRKDLWNRRLPAAA
jgi:2',3'-cyclic-nucleotide 2'-phosphodiesterase/3'-nucleotidase